MPRHELAHSISGTRGLSSPPTTYIAHRHSHVRCCARLLNRPLAHRTRCASRSSLFPDLSPFLATRRRTVGVLGAPESSSSRLVCAVAWFVDQVSTLRWRSRKSRSTSPSWRWTVSLLALWFWSVCFVLLSNS